jgi:hypothetical protein
MKLRHAAALALVGWYLIYPTNSPAPYSGNIFCHNEAPEYWCYETLKNLGIANTSSLWKKNEWKVMKRFVTERECKTELETHGLSAKCMASDDPRLRKK